MIILLNAAHAQPPRPPMRLAQFSYLYIGSGEYDATTREPKAPAFGFQVPFPDQRIVYALKDSINDLLAGELLQAMNAYWDLSLEPAALQLEKANPAFREVPKFKPKLAKGATGWHIFMRVTDKGPITMLPYMPDALKTKVAAAYEGIDLAAIATRLQFECKVLNGADGSEVFSRDMEATLVRSDPPPGQYPLVRVPGLPASFIHCFGQAAQGFFRHDAPERLVLDVAPACLYIPDSRQQQIAQTVRFARQGDQVTVTEGPPMVWMPIRKIERERTSKKKRSGHVGVLDNILASSLKMDVSREKKTSAEYMNRIRIIDPLHDRQFIFHIPTRDTEVEEVVVSGDRSGTVTTENLGGSLSRTLLHDTSYLTAGTDTIARFMFHDDPPENTSDPLLYGWDGRDISTIMPVPAQWSNQTAYAPIGLKGMLYDRPFHISNLRSGNQLDLYYGNEPFGTLRLRDGMPLDGVLYHTDVSLQVWQAMATFALIPFAYFGK
ncbi:MAG TPA: hypothetical protein VK907_07845 [Phnomibacter sp.]|nr:hypothetical protein [Phnomibacter sp.]